ncbi:hypothetical protein DLD77_00320 [Chitinophaga alhagiae]|uniref:Gingipain domain-containing protein n=1 Tax=Chitinophaga alhagiae TaxID=2203219 RepID=A0ABN5LN68_9BACT|nr:C25 family cysteine peptidase [Chitinophaga alhagiae]AWO00259.1 hypothetical protein DLD77_00320 [Chitinophaga alhagiae]
MKKDKLIVSNRSALARKYGQQHKSILADLQSIVQSDKKRGLSTVIVFADDAAAMKKYKAPAVKDAANARQNKLAIDALYRYFQPDYLLLAGAQDVIPFQPLANLLYSEDDEDETIPSDLPYACEAAYSTNPGKFIAPTRVVGRLPDVPGSSNPAYFRSLVKDVTGSKPGKTKDYQQYFSVSVHDWRLSTQESLTRIFGHHRQLQVSPAKGPQWTSAQLKPRAHFINCHGSLEDPCYYGQKGSKYPEAVNAALLAKKISKGTIVAAECCYGAQLYDPSLTETDQLSIANSYLLHHALAFTGSSTIAYGPAEGQGLADLLTQYFLANVIKGASTGRALLEARQRFLDEMGPTLDPYELKTLAQFYLLGDPSLVLTAAPPKTMELRSNRRGNLAAKGIAFNSFITIPRAVAAKKSSTTMQKGLQLLLKTKKFGQAPNKKVFENTPKAAPLARGIKSMQAPVKFHVYSASSFHGKFKDTKVLVVKERNGDIIGYREYVRR